MDLKKQIPAYTAPRGRFEVIPVPAMQFLMIDGHGDPNSSEDYKDALATIYPVAYKLKFLSKNKLDRDYSVMPLEAMWSAEDMNSFTGSRDKSQWDWTVMMMVPDWITGEHLDTVLQILENKRTAPALTALRFGTHHEDLVVQTLHIGPYDDEGPVLARMHYDFIPSHSLRMSGRHHEIYLSDPRRTPPERLRTILRQPVTAPAGNPSISKQK